MAILGHTSRHLFPPHGRGYELFDSSVLLLIFGVVGYVVSPPPENTSKTLAAPLRLISETQLGWLMIAGALVGIVTAYTKHTRVGYIATITVTLALSLNFTVGWIVNGTGIRTVLSIVLYGWIARRLMRDNAEEPDS